MKKFTILIPIYNDWESLKKLLDNINDNIKDITNAEFSCVIVRSRFYQISTLLKLFT
jgi:hypothetical protein